MVIEIETVHGLLHVAPLALDPVSDIAVLGALDNQEFWEQVLAYQAWCEAVTPANLAIISFPSVGNSADFTWPHLPAWFLD